MCSVQEWFVAEEGLRTATPGGEGSLPSLPSGRSLQSSSSVQEYARVATPGKKKKKKRKALATDFIHLIVHTDECTQMQHFV